MSHNINKIGVAQVIAMVIAVSGAFMAIWWAFGFEALDHAIPEWATMRVTTALAFIFSGMVLYFAARLCEGAVEEATEAMLSLSILVVSLFVMINLGSVVFGVGVGADSLFAQETADGSVSMGGAPLAIPTVAAFALVATVGVLILVKKRKIHLYLRWIGGAVAVMGSTALLGYLFRMPYLYYEIPGVAAPMAVYAAILFALCGVGFMLLGFSRETKSL